MLLIAYRNIDYATRGWTPPPTSNAANRATTPATSDGSLSSAESANQRIRDGFQAHQAHEPKAGSAQHKRVLITGEGRSGSTLVGTLFKTEEWSYVYEPLKDRFPDPLRRMFNGTVPGGRPSAPRVSVSELLSDPRCSRLTTNLCTAAKAAVVLEELSCERTPRPEALLALEIDGATEAAAAAEAALLALEIDGATEAAAAAEACPEALLALEIDGATEAAAAAETRVAARALLADQGAAAAAAAAAARSPPLSREARGQPPLAAQWRPPRASGKKVGYEHATAGAAALARASGLYDDATAAAAAAAAAPLSERAVAAGGVSSASAGAGGAGAGFNRGQLRGGGGGCEGKQGVAVKIIRMPGRLGELLEMAAALGQTPDLVIHLIRDPRAVLASRYSVGWGVPENRGYDATLDWANIMCSGTLLDAERGEGHDEYVLLRYEDMARGAELAAEAIYARFGRLKPQQTRIEACSLDVLLRYDMARSAELAAEAIYARLGVLMPPAVREKMRESDGCKAGHEAERHQCMERVSVANVTKYSTAPRDFQEQNQKWKYTLPRRQVRAVETGCRGVFDRFYPRMPLRSRRKPPPQAQAPPPLPPPPQPKGRQQAVTWQKNAPRQAPTLAVLNRSGVLVKMPAVFAMALSEAAAAQRRQQLCMPADALRGTAVYCGTAAVVAGRC
ncbi:hypothetical protein JKP88DRAFT_266860 [Tribonema minus]|uniref:Uncharacterized protein n=1 Tax=Tribonema minus TaxID=303371 RepID=A0A835ZCJ1_9STRA|nr:hypothetical protein JKP88DRAFT_266860 [Tribonema minus]